ncbi:hypothetical protein WJX74_000850 [Apatococcus lobatus]|uniref:Uncharacterized protein n=1 Tax=Apatococcus lobatus TaxID=904363 RepID=A0AAW1RUW6_9CHLO
MSAAGRLATFTALWAGGVNLGSAGIFYYDKKWAMQQFKHKTSKKSFQEKYDAAVAANVAGIATVVSIPKARTHLLKAWTRFIR